MYEGHPKNVNVHDAELALSDRPAKPDTQQDDEYKITETEMIVAGILNPPDWTN